MSLTVIFADYLSGSISTSDALRRSGFGAIDELMVAVRAESDARANARSPRLEAGRTHASHGAK